MSTAATVPRAKRSSTRPARSRTRRAQGGELKTKVSRNGQGTAAPSHRAPSHGQGTADPSPCGPGHPEGTDRELDRILRATLRRVPAVELAPSEFAAARTGLEADPLLLRMVDRLVDAVRLYAVRDDGGVRARVVAEQWIRYRNYLGKVASGEYPRPSQRGPAVVE